MNIDPEQHIDTRSSQLLWLQSQEYHLTIMIATANWACGFNTSILGDFYTFVAMKTENPREQIETNTMA